MMIRDVRETHHLRSIISIGLVFLSGIFFHWVSYYVGKEWLQFSLRSVGLTLCVSGTVVALQGYVVRKDFIDIVRGEMASVVDEKVPKSLKNLHEAGIFNAYESLDIQNLLKSLNTMTSTEIRILKIWIPEIHLLQDALFDALENRDCRARIILLDPSMDGAISKRAETVDCTMDKEMIQTEIVKNIKVLEGVRSKLTNPENLSLALHQNLISVSMAGTDGEFKIGFYLNGRFATSGPQLKVRGARNYFYQAFNDHFEREWESATQFKHEPEVESSDTQCASIQSFPQSGFEDGEAE